MSDTATDGEDPDEATARALVRGKELFERRPGLIEFDEQIPGCGLLTYSDLYVLHRYALLKFNED